MSGRGAKKHKTTVEKKNQHPGMRFPGSKKSWVVECTCGFSQSAFHKDDTLKYEREHLEKPEWCSGCGEHYNPATTEVNHGFHGR